MKPDGPLERAVQALAAGDAVDWEAAETVVDDPADAATLHQLRVVAGIATFHRQSGRAAARSIGDTQPAPNQWGSLRLIRQIGRGAFGDVYEAYDPHLERTVALKLLQDGEPSTDRTREAIQEGTLLARVRHPHVVTVFGAGRLEGRTGVWMEFIRGRTLAEVIARDGVMSASETARVGRDVCRGLAAVHAAGVVHRDVKAQNVMREDGGRLVLMDFGAGFDGDGETGKSLAGTPAYLAPEILRGEPATPESDIFSVGVLLYFLLTKTFPVAGNSIADLKKAHAERQVVPLRHVRPDVPRTLASIVERALDPDPSCRFTTAESLAAAFDRQTTSRRRRRRQAFVVVVALIAVGLATLVLSRTDARQWIPNRSATLASMVETLAKSVPPPVRSDVAGSWEDIWIQSVCEYACGSPPGTEGTTMLIVTSDSETAFHGMYGVFPITGTVNDGSISFVWRNYQTWAGISQGLCKGTVFGKHMAFSCSSFIASPSEGLLLSGTNTDQLTKAISSGLVITSVLDPPRYLNIGQPFQSFTAQAQYMNQGTGQSQTAVAEFFLSASGSTRDVLLGSATLPALGPYQTGLAASLVRADPVPPPGKYFLLACIGADCRRSAAQLLVGGANRRKFPAVDQDTQFVKGPVSAQDSRTFYLVEARRFDDATRVLNQVEMLGRVQIRPFHLP